jgi:hypothetical protein
MHAGRDKRIYNVVFVLLTLCTFVFVFRVSEGLITTAIFEAQESQHQKFLTQSQLIYNELVKEGKIEEAKTFQSDPQSNFFGTLLSMDEKGNLFAIKYNSVDRRIKFCEDNLELLSTITALITYTVSYFLLWFIITFVVRYVRKAPDTSPV